MTKGQAVQIAEYVHERILNPPKHRSARIALIRSVDGEEAAKAQRVKWIAEDIAWMASELEQKFHPTKVYV